MKVTGLKSLVWIGLSSTCLFALQNCKDPEPPSYECTSDITVPYPEDVLERFYFKDGSYWIYENSNSPGVYDSIYVEKSYQTTEAPDPEIHGSIRTRKCYDSYNSKHISANYGSLILKFGYGSAKEGFNYPAEYFELMAIGEMTDFNDLCLLGLDGNVYRELNCENNSVQLVDSLGIDGQWYYNLLYIDKGNADISCFEKVWYAKGIGAVRIVRKDGSDWKMSRYNIVQ